MVNQALYLALALTVFSLKSEAYQMTRCELVSELRRQGFLENDMTDWVCLVESESGRRTDVIGPENSNGSHDYGLFQINDKWWCSNTTTPGKDCNVTCADLITDDITTATTCAKKIFSIQGFDAWHGWQKSCQGQLPDISDC